MADSTCTSCKVNILNLKGAVKFKCPKCGDINIIRCPTCRKTGVKYQCSKCGNEGP